jgi:hypothetical protein
MRKDGLGSPFCSGAGIAIASVEYNRHDKTYYYVEEFDLRVEAVA